MTRKALSQDDRERYNNEVCNEINKGRKCKTEEYMKTLVTFGYIFCGSKLPQRTDIPTAIKNGVKINDVMTLNMEALMRTILDTGCRRDWPGYLNSSEYKNWFKQQHGTKKKSKGKRKQSVDIKNQCDKKQNKKKLNNTLSTHMSSEMLSLVHRQQWEGTLHSKRTRLE